MMTYGTMHAKWAFAWQRMLIEHLLLLQLPKRPWMQQKLACATLVHTGINMASLQTSLQQKAMRVDAMLNKLHHILHSQRVDRWQTQNLRGSACCFYQLLKARKRPSTSNWASSGDDPWTQLQQSSVVIRAFIVGVTVSSMQGFLPVFQGHFEASTHLKVCSKSWLTIPPVTQC